MVRPKQKIKKVKVSLSLSPESLEFLKSQTENLSEYVDTLLRQKAKIRKIKKD